MSCLETFPTRVGISLKVLPHSVSIFNQVAKENMTQVSLESFQNIRTVKAFAAEDTETKSYGESNRTVFYRGLQKQLLGAVFQSLIQMLMYGGMAAVILTATWLI